MGKAVYLKVEKSIRQPVSDVWNTVAMGFGNVALYNPEIRSSCYDSEQRSGAGTRRHCDFQKKGFIKEEITEWNEGKSFRLKFTESSVPMARLESKFTFTEEEHGTRIDQEFWYRMKPPFGWLSGMMKTKMKSTLINGLEGLDRYMASGLHNKNNNPEHTA